MKKKTEHVDVDTACDCFQMAQLVQGWAGNHSHESSQPADVCQSGNVLLSLAPL